ncbi:MAG: hypothetical protein KME15_21160 [Drouetiella hepatica Uher 2000/2452]|jgi:hypothetical protein|uniref:Uncharacterized protein n=1 Tax=Drouetiella hepatica Uher 2000/2452 TaxID=904376 RepID=A0A951QFQ3_9CYAN|nr:hypothetical protein [Drouetiella hepatica Uher 2000/2452]
MMSVTASKASGLASNALQQYDTPFAALAHGELTLETKEIFNTVLFGSKVSRKIVEVINSRGGLSSE